jgi:glutamate N-acetyltransferase/amino-acid N-acetyltransferase
MKFVKGGMSIVHGFKSIGIHAGLKKCKKDLAVIYSETMAVFAGVFTKNKVKAAPVLVTQKHLEETRGYCRAIVINSANANACTGEIGLNNAVTMAKVAANELNIDQKEVLVSSTGVIGVQLPMDTIVSGIKKACSQLTTNDSAAAAEAIMTTDTYPKEAAVETVIDGKVVRIGGMAKGSGMIHPNMATMLSFIATDVAISQKMLQKVLKEVVDDTFNMISVDGDTSTNDMVLIAANSKAGNDEINDFGKNYDIFKKALGSLCYKLSEHIVRDGEGATKFVTVTVNNANTVEDARKAARSVTTSALVKTAIFGEDANWGRVIMAIGNSGADFNPDNVSIYIESNKGREQMMKDGMGLPFDEENAKNILSEQDIKFTIDLAQGNASATAWTCDFSYDYVKINADYRS